MREMYEVGWTNPDKGFSGEMHNVRGSHLEETVDRAWIHAGPNGQVEFGEERHEVTEYGC